ncbi:MAG: DUF2238 domain-containing protein [Gammaproteobacteria bacterium]
MTQCRHWPAVLLALYVPVWVLCAIEPLYPSDWLLENVLVFLFVPLIIWQHRRAPATNAAYACLFLFFCLHSLGSHYTYAEVPYDRWWQSLTGSTFNELAGWQRNHYDRLVHFAYGLLTTPIWVGILQRHVHGLRGLWCWLVPLTFMMSHSLAYELIEWVAALLFGGDLGEAYLGTQGDVWDAHWDMLLASSGSAVTLAIMAATGSLSAPPANN